MCISNWQKLEYVNRITSMYHTKRRDNDTCLILFATLCWATLDFVNNLHFWVLNRQIKRKAKPLVLRYWKYLEKNNTRPWLFWILEQIKEPTLFFGLFNWNLILWKPWQWIKFDYLLASMNLKNHPGNQWRFNVNSNIWPTLVYT